MSKKINCAEMHMETECPCGAPAEIEGVCRCCYDRFWDMFPSHPISKALKADSSESAKGAYEETK